MRFPEVQAMNSSLKLIEHLQRTTPQSPLKTKPYVLSLGPHDTSAPNYSNGSPMQEWLGRVHKLSFKEIGAMEVAETGTALFSQSILETILDYFDFNAAGK